jgi:Secretion system C-terminal sorting domain
MKKFTTLVSTLLLSLTLFCINASAQTYSMYDVPITWNGSKFKFVRNTVIHRQVRFTAPANLPTRNSTIGIKPEANAPRTSLRAGESYTYTFSGTGKKNVSIYYDFYTAKNQLIRIEELVELEIRVTSAVYQKPDETWTITTAENFTPLCESSAFPNEKPQKGFAAVYVKYGAGHNNKLVRPFIFVDGIDFDPTTYTDPNNNNEIVRHGNTGWDVLTMGADDGKLDILPGNQEDYDAFKEYPIAFQKLVISSQANGGDSYDIMFVDFSSGADYIQRNSLLLQEVLRQVNQRKVANAQGRVNKNVVLGASMGGLVVRHALTSMEKRGENHCTHTYISFDAPQKGANIPLSIQAMGWFLNKSIDDPQAKGFWKNLSMPAPRQLLINHFGDVAKNNGGVTIEKINWSANFDTNIPEDYKCLRTEFVKEMNDLDYPKDARNIAVSCGSTLGNVLANQGYQSGSELFDAHINVASFGRVGQAQLYASGSSTWSPLTANDYYVMARCHPNLGFTRKGITTDRINVLFAAALPISTDAFLAGTPWGDRTPCEYNGIVVRNNNPTGLNMDHVQGCKRGDFPTVRRLLNGYASGNGGTLGIDEVTYQRSFCFMPTMSTLDIKWDMTQTNLERVIDLDAIVRNNLTPFAAIYAPSNDFENGKNLKHVEISQSMVTWLQSEMQIGEAAGGETITLPLGLTRQLVFNKDGIISRNVTINEYGKISLNGDPSVKVGLGGCGSVQVDINSGGRFDIGSATTVGQVMINVNSIVKIGIGGTLNLANGSQMIIENGGKLIIDAGANLSFNGSGNTAKIVVKKGGELVMNGNFNYTGPGYFQFDQGHKFTLNSDIVLKGHGFTSQFFVLSDAPPGTENRLKITGHSFSLSNALIYYGDNSQIEINNDSNLSQTNTFMDVFFSGYNNSATALNCTNPEGVEINRCNFSNLLNGVVVKKTTDADLYVVVSNTTFFAVNNALSEKATPNYGPVNAGAFIENCQFDYIDGSLISGTACRFENLREAYINGNTFSGYPSFGNWKNYTAVELINSGIQTGLGGNSISYFKTGINAEIGYNALDFYHGNINHCEVGINFNGGIDYSLALYCSKIVDNMTGIKGVNTFGTSLGMGNELKNAPNPNSLLFDICYPVVRGQNQQPIDLSNNYWVGGFRNMKFSIMRGQNSDCSINGSRRFISQYNEYTRIPSSATNCGEDEWSDGCGKRLIYADGTGLGGVIEGEIIQCFAGGSGTNALKAQKPANETASKADKDKLTIYPNPANETVKLDADNGNYTLKVLNTVGQTIFTQNTEGSLSLDVSTWTNGIYLFEVTNKATNKQQRSKIVIQH